MNKDRNALKAGTFIVVSFILAVAVVVSIKDFGNFAEKSVVRSARFKMADNLGGLRVGDDLRVGGFRVGSVTSIEPTGFDGKSEQTVVVNFTIPEKYVLRDGAKVAVETSLTGAALLNVQDLGTGNAIPDGTAVAGVPDPKNAFLANLGEAKVAEAVAELKETIAQARAKIDPAFDKYASVADRAGETMVNARDTMAHAKDLLGEGKGDLKGTFANLNAASGTVKEKLPETFEKANNLLTKVQGSVDKVQATLDDVKVTVANTKDVSAAAKSVISGNRSKLDSMIASLKKTGDNLQAASSEIRRSPWRLLYKPGKGEMANLNLYDSARQFAEGANDMNDAATALRDALASKDVDGKQLQALVDRLDKSFTSFQKVESQLWERVSVRE
jgi:ABC-type transporter Mla subunit MlaD